jgi:hypothetical protein
MGIMCGYGKIHQQEFNQPLWSYQMNDDLEAKLDWDDLIEKDDEARCQRRMRDEEGDGDDE